MKKHLLLVFLSFWVVSAYPQTVHRSFEHLNITNGLPENTANDICQDQQGYIWLATNAGVVRYDGMDSKVYKPGLGDKKNFPSAVFPAVFQDKRHNIWTASFYNGFFEYDRRTDRFVQVRSPLLTANDVLAAAVADSSGNVWSVFQSNNDKQWIMEKFETSAHRFSRYSSSQKGKFHFPVDTLHDVKIDENGHFSVRASNGNFTYDNASGVFVSSTAVIAKRTGLDVKRVYQLPADHHLFWLSLKGAALAKFDDRNGRTVSYQLNGDTAVNWFEDNRKRLWLTTHRGLSLYDPARDHFINYTLPDSIKRNVQGVVLTGLLSDKQGLLWMILGNQLLSFDAALGHFTSYRHDIHDPTSILYSRGINRLLLDRSGSLWIAQLYAGADHIDPVKSAFSVSDFRLGDIADAQRSGNGTILIATSKGIYSADERTGQNRLLVPFSGLHNYDALLQSTDGKLYYTATPGGGLLTLDPRTGKTERFVHDEKDPASLHTASQVNIAMQDHNGLVWLGASDKGICSFDQKTKKFKRYPYISNNGRLVSKNMLDDALVEIIYEDREGTVWVGTANGGVNFYDRDKDRFVSGFRPDNGVTSIETFTEDHLGRIWVGTALNGLFLIDRKTALPLKHLDAEHGLNGSEVSYIKDDGKGFLWTSGQLGLSRISLADYSIRKFPTAETPWAEIFQNLNSRWSYVSATTGNQFTVFGNDKKVTVDLDALQAGKNPPPVYLQTVTYSNPQAKKPEDSVVQVYGSEKLELSHSQNKLTFSYAAVEFNDPSGISYAYKLDGYDGSWINYNAQRAATYTNLSPGTYTFRVIAKNSDGVWNNKGDKFVVIIDPPWWQTWWAWFLGVVLFGWAIYAFINYRSRKLLRDKKILEHKVQVRTEEVQQQKEEIEAQRDNLEQTLSDLKSTQTQLIQSEKMASLGELTAGIAHEIQNPLNFVNNFSEVNKEMLEELKAESKKPKAKRDAVLEIELMDNLIENEQKINHHGKRADSIVKGMLEHSRNASGQKEPIDINQLADEYLRLSYHGLRAKDKSFNAELVTNFDEKLPKATIMAQDIGRVLLNLYNNAFYAVNQKSKTSGQDYKAEVSVTTSTANAQVIIKVKDNGVGIPDAVKEKIMQPFFTTKPTGEGTGLGLSLTYDMVVKGHGGSIAVNTKEHEFTEFIIRIPMS